MSENLVVRLRGKTVTITEPMREAILEEMPEIGWIASAELRTKVLNAWAAAIAASGFKCIGDMKPSGNYDSKPLVTGTQGDHIRSVARIALSMAEDLNKNFPGFTYNRDILIAGALCHDIGKVWEFDPDNVARWRADPNENGMPSIRHPGYGVYICLTLELPEAVAHCAGAHSGEGELLERSLENTIIRWADHSFWMIIEKGRMVSEVDTWLPPAKVS
ncbi:HD domain-containing protein [Devosia sp. YIM 151766]|uniref:HD domain-containing protein n=1 Tax=Devosia sp. YIM 151766 TaxID=3017325 RepID=UPI00255C8F46|nr:HD domain-containing protein [Devosia sp. YIM 151766]WIY52392.1 HD domain-containing protein [Devosia sp. YIM 151766]